MGLFSGKRKQNDTKTTKLTPNEYVNVLARLPSDEHSSAGLILWSLCVEKPLPTQLAPEQLKQIKSTKNKSNQKPKSEDNSPQVKHSHSPTEYIEFSLSDGQLSVSPLSWPPSNTTKTSNTMLLKIQLPLNGTTPSNQQPLCHQVERILHTMSSTNTNLPDTDTDCWIRFSLIALQQANILPQGKHFNVNDFMSYAENQFTEFEAEALASSTNDSHNKNTKSINYQSHLDENARLRAMLKRSSVEFESSSPQHQNDNDNDEKIDEEPRKGKGLIKGWWISKPHARGYNYSSNDGRERDGDERDSYGGLM